MEVNRDFLFGIIALQEQLISPDQLAEALADYQQRGNLSLPDILRGRNWIQPKDSELVQWMLERRLAKTKGDVRRATESTLHAESWQILSSVESGKVWLAGLTPPTDPTRVSQTPGHISPPTSRGYEFSHIHAQGGLGQVWMARDLSTGRHVALKEVRPDRLDEQPIVNRFLREARITAQLEHPNIVPVYELDANPSGRSPFYTMRFIKGNTLRQAVAEYHGRIAANEAEPIELVNLINSFLAVCNAVGYANSRGVIHRDIKSQNVALGGFGEVAVLDWGLAKVAGVDDPEVAAIDLADHDDLSTLAGELLGTPAYMSPEQARGESDQVDPRSDVYSLGAMLYEILTNRPPQRHSSAQQIIAQILTGQIDPPRDTVSDIPRELEAICLKSLSPDPADRYQSATALARDIQRWLADEPTEVYRENLIERTTRLAKRYKTATASVAVLLVSALVSLSIGTVLISREKLEVARARNQAEANFATARAAVNEMLTEASSEYFAQIPGAEDVRRKLLQKALVFHRRFLRERGDDPNVNLETASAYMNVAKVQRLLGDLKRAADSYQRAIELLQAIPPENKPDVSLNVAVALGKLGLVCSEMNELAEAGSYYERARAAFDSLRSTGAVELESELAALLTNQARHAYQQADIAGAERSYREALRIHEDTLPDEEQVEVRLSKTRIHANLGTLYAQVGRLEESASQFEQADQFGRQLLEGPRATPDLRFELAVVALNFGGLLQLQGKLEPAGEQYRWAGEQMAGIIDPPALPRYRRLAATVLANRGLLLARKMNWTDSERLLDQAIGEQRKLTEEFPDNLDQRGDLAKTLVEKGLVLAARQQSEKAAELWIESRAILEEITTANPKQPDWQKTLAKLLSVLAIREMGKNNLGATTDLLNQSLKANTQVLVIRPDDFSARQVQAKIEGNLGKLAYDRADYALARRLFEQSRAGFLRIQETVAAVPIEAIQSTYYLGLTLRQLDKLERSLELIDEAWTLIEHIPFNFQIVLIRKAIMEQRPLAFALVGQYREAAEATELFTNSFKGRDDRYSASVLFAAAAEAAQNASPPDQVMSEQFQSRAMELMQAAVDSGFDDVLRITSEPQLKILRSRKDFQELMIGMNK